MATDFHISIVEGVVGYQFGDKGHLKLALTSAGAEEDNHDGNRTLAMIGEAAAQLAAVDSGYEKAASRDKIHNFHHFIKNKAQRELAAKRAGIVECIKLCKRSGPTKTVLSIAVSAIIGAAWKDSDSLSVVARVVKRLILLSNEESAVDPTVLEGNEAAQDRSIPSHGSLLFDETWAHPIESSKRSKASVDAEPAGDQQQGRCGIQAASHPVSGSEAEASVTPPNASNVGNNSLCDVTLLEDGYAFSPPERSVDPGISKDTSYLGIADVTIDDDDLVMFSFPESEPAATSAQGPSHIASGPHAEDTLLPNSSDDGPRAVTVRSKRPCASDQESLAALLSSYIIVENERCVNRGVPGPQDTFLADRVVNGLNNLASKDMETFLQISVGICSPEAVAALQETVRRFRADQGAELPSPLENLSAKERI